MPEPVVVAGFVELLFVVGALVRLDAVVHRASRQIRLDL